MRTKALLLAAAFAAAGVATSVAQVYSVNAVGYVNVSLTPGFNLVSNPLDAGAGNNTVGNLFKNITPTPLNGFRVYVFNESTGAFDSVQWNPIGGGSFGTGAVATTAINPGSGAFVFNPDLAGTAARTLTFVGEVKQGTLSNPLPLGFSVKANMVPQAGSPSTFGFPGTLGDRFFKFDPTTGGYAGSLFGNPPPAQWRPALPSIGVGEAFFIFRATAAGSWDRTFNVNNPS